MDVKTANDLTARMIKVLSKEFPELEFKFKGGKVHSNSLIAKFSIIEAGKDSPEMENARSYAPTIGIKLETEDFKIIGKTLRRNKFSWLYMEKSTGNRFKATQERIKELFGS